ncbi:uncharacterized protein LOC129581274 [Paramacrobiotus metropolitanus]|uniref:uncharacterized protein LOC129581274 n=1 Tax=Paramacrobiotus metropolitanus TaxID=2943436 RepID=UPI002445D113|nr:uncharacterized protein LOC129581274 [Paramacrobiotus metropolitanus]
MANERVEIYISVVKGRQILMACSVLLIVLGLIVLGHEIAVCVLTQKNLSPPSAAQIIGTIGAGLSIIAGIVTFLPARLGSPLVTLRRNFILATAANLVAAVLLIVSWVLFGPFVWNIWTEANQFTNAPRMRGQRYLNMGVEQNWQEYPTYNPLSFRFEQDFFYNIRLIAILKLVALLAELLLAAAAVLAMLLSLVNVFSLRSSHIPLAGQEVVHVQSRGGKNEVYYENTRRLK